jgi:5-methyltetrahydropteroyltriglutamate--homocysteine methyltransferase
MATTHNLGFPRIGHRRQLKFALESYWRGETDASALHATAREIRGDNQRKQSVLDWRPVGDFSLYDHVLDTCLMLGHWPERFHTSDQASRLERYFQVARGRGADPGHRTDPGLADCPAKSLSPIPAASPEVAVGYLFRLPR